MNGATVLEILERRAAEAPDAPAVITPRGTWSYRALVSDSDRLAARLASLGIGAEIRAGIFADRSYEMIAGLFGVLKAGGTFVPIDPAHPEERRRAMIEDAAIEQMLDGERIEALLRGLPNGSVRSEIHPEQGAYVIFTSGSTGRPKGVLIPHRGLLNLALAQIEAFGVTRESRVLQFASPSFDAAISEILMALLAGASLHLAPRERLLPGEALEALIREREISVITLPPSALATIDPTAVPSLRTVISAGEACSSELASKWIGAGRRFFNAYGPSETTVCATIAEPDSSQRPPIGRPIANTTAYVLGRSMQPVADGEPGELYVGGIGVGRGYLGRPDLTAAAFVPDPFSREPGARLYRTGDLARRLPNGELEFLGRSDQQVKVRGHRIELSEIEECLVRHPEVNEAVACALDQRLVAYFIKKGATRPSIRSLRAHAVKMLPDFMVPQLFIEVDRWPLSPNGKIDRERLPEPKGDRPPLATDYCAPRDELELELVEEWEEVLGVRPIGIFDDFFELGGHSLMAAGLMARIERKLKRSIPLSALFGSPTIDTMARELRAGGARFEHRTLVAIKKGSDRLPLFLAHPTGGNVLCYAELARRLDGSLPIIGIQARGLDPAQPPHRTVEEMASFYVDAIKAHQKEGPYRIAGWSGGGTIAFEIARQLHLKGDEIGFLGIIDALSPSAAAIASAANRVKSTSDLLADDAKVAYIFVRNIERAAGIDAPVDDARIRNLSREQVIEYALDRLRSLNYLPSSAGPERMAKLIELFGATVAAVHDYAPPPHPGRITLFRSEERHPDFDRPPALGWEAFALGGVEVVPVPGNHYTLVSPPHVDVLAAELGRRLG